MRYLHYIFTCLAVILLSCGKDESFEISEPGTLGDGLITLKIEEIRSSYDIPALGGFFIKNGLIIETGASGIRADGFDEKVTSSDKWHLGSITKAMTATMVARLVDKQELDWSVTIQEIFPDELQGIREEYHSIQLDELFSHTSGIHNDVINVPSWNAIRNEQDTEENLRYTWSIEMLGKAPAGIRGNFYYSNAGYIIGAAMVEKITGRKWRELMRTELFDPLEMDNTGFMAPGTSGRRDQPWGHAVARSKITALDPGDPYSDNPKALGPAGVVHSTFFDLAIYMQMHIDGDNGNSEFLSNQAFSKLHSPFEGTDYSLGWSSGIVDGIKILNHDGSNRYWYARIILNTSSNLGLVMVTNQGDDSAIDAINSLNDLFSKRFQNYKN
jgi:CubicO group peptidase (beta-lactamase class C family)